MKKTAVSALLLSALALACSHEPDSAAPAAATASNASVPAPSASAAATTPAAAAPGATPASVAAPTTAAASELAVGDVAPDFSTADQDGKPVRLADLKGHYVVVYFYPKDETPGCTHEACSFRDSWVKLKTKGVTVIGVSMDTADSHKAFAKNHQLPFTLVSDPKGDIAAKYQVPVQDGYEKRQSFVVGPDGKVKKIYRKVDVQTHADEILADTSS